MSTPTWVRIWQVCSRSSVIYSSLDTEWLMAKDSDGECWLEFRPNLQAENPGSERRRRSQAKKAGSDFTLAMRAPESGSESEVRMQAHFSSIDPKLRNQPQKSGSEFRLRIEALNAARERSRLGAFGVRIGGFFGVFPLVIASYNLPWIFKVLTQFRRPLSLT